MLYKSVKIFNKQYNIIWIILILLFCSIISLLLIKYINYTSQYENYINDNTLSKSYNLGVCSQNCCATQWTVPINLTKNSKIHPNLIGKKYFTSNLTCNNGVNNTGCVCLTSKSKKLFEKRGFINKLPIGNGLLEQDNRKSAFNIMDNKILKSVNVLDQTSELTGTKNENNIHGKLINKYDNHIDKYGNIANENEIAKNYTMAINNNIISFDNQLINNTINQSNDNNLIDLSKNELLIKNPLGLNTKNIIIIK